jgi:hypothetical protein
MCPDLLPRIGDQLLKLFRISGRKSHESEQFPQRRSIIAVLGSH